MFRSAVLFILGALSGLTAAEGPDAEKGQLRLCPRDQVRVSVQGEPDVGVDRQVDGRGEVNLPLLGPVQVAGLTIAEAQLLIVERYVKEEIFIRPEVVVMVTAYAPKEVTLLGQIAKQGKILFPSELTSLSLVEAIASSGGLTRIAKGDAVRITRRDAQGVEQTVTVNVDKMVEGRGETRETFYLLPGDVVFVPERVF